MVGTLSIPKSLRADRVPDLLRRILLSAALAPAVFRAQRASATHLRRAEQAPLYERALLQCGAPALCATCSPEFGKFRIGTGACRFFAPGMVVAMPTRSPFPIGENQ